MTPPRTRKTVDKATDKPQAAETGSDILKRIQPQRRTERTTICLNSQLIREFQEAEAKLVEMMGASSGNSNRLNTGASVESAEESDDTTLRAQARKIRAIEQKIVDSQVEFVFMARNKGEFTALCADHPPRPNNQLDQIIGYHRDQVIDAMVRASLVSPVFEDCRDRECDHTGCGTWQQLESVVNPSEWGELRDTANDANSEVNDAPKSALASRILDRRASTSS